jgi:uncharacterized protein YqhQ
MELTWSKFFKDLVLQYKGDEKKIVAAFLIYCYEEEREITKRWSEDDRDS